MVYLLCNINQCVIFVFMVKWALIGHLTLEEHPVSG